jgi:hypothetical protein
MAVARKPDALPAAVAAKLTAAGYSPEVATLIRIIDDFTQQRREQAAKLDDEPQPLKQVVPDGVSYERARRAAEAGRLVAEKIGATRWSCTPSAMAGWLASIGFRPRQ